MKIRRFVMNIENSTLSDIKIMLERINFKEEDSLYVLGGLFDQQTPENSVENMKYIMSKKNINYILGYTEYLYISFSTFTKALINKEEGCSRYDDWYKLYKLNLEKNKEFFLGMSKILRDNPEYMMFLRSCPLYELIYCSGFQYMFVYGSPFESKTEKNKDLIIKELQQNQDMFTVPPNYRNVYRIQLKQGEIINSANSEYAVTDEKELEQKNEIPIILISACQKTGSIIKKGDREKMPVLDTGNVIAINTGGVHGKEIGGMNTQLSCVEIHSGEIFYL